VEHDPLVLDLVEIYGSLEGRPIGDYGVNRGVLCGAGHAWDRDGADDPDDHDNNDQLDERER